MFKNLLKIKNLFITLIASIIVMFGCVLMWFFVSREASITSTIAGLIAMFLLFGAIDYWEKTLKSWFKIDDNKENNKQLVQFERKMGVIVKVTPTFVYIVRFYIKKKSLWIPQ